MKINVKNWGESLSAFETGNQKKYPKPCNYFICFYPKHVGKLVIV